MSQGQITITFDRETNQAGYHLDGLSHQEAQIILLDVLRANHDHAIGEAAGRHHQHDIGDTHDH